MAQAKSPSGVKKEQSLSDSINEDVVFLLEPALKTRFAALAKTSFDDSRKWFEEEPSHYKYFKRILAKGPAGFTVLHKYFAVATERLKCLDLVLREAESLMQLYSDTLGRLRNNFMVLRVAGEEEAAAHHQPSVDRSTKGLSSEAVQFYTGWKKHTDAAAAASAPRPVYQFWPAPAPTPDPLAPYDKQRQVFETMVAHLRVAFLLYRDDSKELVPLLFTALRGNCVAPPESLYNWPAICGALRSLWARVQSLKGQAKGEGALFSRREAWYLRRQLRHLCSVIFNSDEARKAVPVLEKRDVWDPLVAAFPKAPEGASLSLDFFSPAQYHADVFRQLTVLSHDILAVEGDGNCFFRAVIRYLFPAIPRELEDMYSIMLRERVNAWPLSAAANKRLAGFEIDKESDAGTMAKVGVWADHTQVERLSDYLRTSIWLVHNGDRKISMRPDGRLVPGEDYQIGSHYFNEAGLESDDGNHGRHHPIILYYTPSPGHYEPLFFRKKRHAPSRVLSSAQVPLALAESSALNGGAGASPRTLCDAYFALEADTAAADRASNSSKDWSIGFEAREAAKSEMDTLITSVCRALALVKHTLDRMGPTVLLSAPDLDSRADAPPAGAALDVSVLPASVPMLEMTSEARTSLLYFLTILRPLLDDALVIVGDEVVQRGKGPLSRILAKLKSLRSPYSSDADWSSLKFGEEKKV